MSNEDIYQNEILPLWAKIREIADRHEIPISALFQLDDGKNDDAGKISINVLNSRRAVGISRVVATIFSNLARHNSFIKGNIGAIESDAPEYPGLMERLAELISYLGENNPSFEIGYAKVDGNPTLALYATTPGDNGIIARMPFAVMLTHALNARFEADFGSNETVVHRSETTLDRNEIEAQNAVAHALVQSKSAQKH